MQRVARVTHTNSPNHSMRIGGWGEGGGEKGEEKEQDRGAPRLPSHALAGGAANPHAGSR